MDFLKGIYYGILQFDSNSICFGILLFVILLSIIRAKINTAIVCILACVVIIGALEYSPQDIYYKAQEKIKDAKQVTRYAVEKTLDSELANADVIHHDDGSYELVISNVKIEGKKGDPSIVVHYKQKRVTFNIDDFGPNVEQILTDVSNNKDLAEIQKDVNVQGETSPAN